MLKTTTLTVVLAFGVLTAGCLQKETRHVLYLDPDGAVAWAATESDVRSDEKDPAARAAEEREYLAASESGTHRVGLGLMALQPDGPVRTTIVRRDRPFTAVTEARFTAIEQALQRLFAENGIETSVSVRREEGRAILLVRLDFAVQADVESPAAALLEDLDTLTFVMTEGRFVEADGFELSDDGRKARFSAAWLSRAEAVWEAKSAIELSLTWGRKTQN
jgi:hypothetical protein